MVFLMFGFLGLFGVVEAQYLTPVREAELKLELAAVEAEQKQAEAALDSAKQKSASISRDISVLDAKIRVAKLNIKAKNLLIESLGKDIQTKQARIGALDGRIERGRETLALILRKTNERDDYSLPEVLLSQNTVADFFGDVDAFQSVQNELKRTFVVIRSDKAETEAAKEILDKRRDAEIDARYAIQQEQKNIENDEKEKQKLLAISKSAEKSYSSILAEKRKRAGEIKATLFTLRDVEPIPFGQALQYAAMASQKTGVRPAFLLAIFAQESSLNRETSTFGNHVGSCYLTDASTGAGISVKTRSTIAKVMSATRDTGPFLEITKALNIDPYTTLVSCPLSIGYGGAMGPAQFIASTWLLIKDRLSRYLNISDMPNPWNPAHAFMASALYLSDLGAGSQTYSAERSAACRYYSGKSCGSVSGSSSYGNSVMKYADSIQRTMIDPLQGV